MTGLYDSWQRQINYLRISVTDHCNLRCMYCSAGSLGRLSHNDILRYEEIQRIVRIAAGMGITKIRLTGGEPLLRPGVADLVALIAKIEGIDDISLTTNGILLSQYAADLKKAGLNRVNMSLDTLKADRFENITGGNKLQAVMDGIESAHRFGLEPVKINMVVMRGMNDDEVLDFARLTVSEGWHVRYIEYMPFGSPEAQALGTVTAREIKDKLDVLGKLEPYGAKMGNGPAKYYRLPGAEGTIGFINAITEHFCESCNRLRLTSDGHLRPCLLADDEVNLKTALRDSATDDDLKALIQQAVTIKREEYHLSEYFTPGKRPMYQIGG